MRLSATNTLPVGTLYCRSANNSCRIWFLTATRTDSVWHGILGTCKHGHAPYHVLDSREHGPWSLGHQLCTLVHDSLRGQVCISMNMHATHKWRPRPYHVKVKGLGDRELRRVTSLIVWTFLNPHTRFDTPNQVMQCMLCKHGSTMQPNTKVQTCHM